MKATIILAGLSLIVGCTLLLSLKRDDGFALYARACEYHDSLNLKDSPAEVELLKFLDKGGVPGTLVADLIKQEQKAFSLILKAHSKQHWKMPDITTFSDETTFPDLMPWLGINRVATAQAIEFYLDGKPETALSFLVPYNTTGLKVSKAGVIFHILVHVLCRETQYPVLASSIDDLPETSLAEELHHAKEQYEQIPNICDYLAGELHLEINTAKRLFTALRAEQSADPMPNQMKMIQNLKKAGVDDKTIKQIEEEEVLSVADWENQVLSDFRRFQAFYTNALATRTSSELRKVDDEIKAEIEKVGAGVEFNAAMVAWNRFMINPVSGSFSMAEAKRLHSQFGRAISYQNLCRMMPAIGAIGIKYKEFLASERLLLIRLAVRMYVHKHGKSPLTLQQLVDDELLNEEMITDPLSGKVFLTKADGTLEAYSVGGDLDDDNGVPWNKKTKMGDTILIPLKAKWSVQQAESTVPSKVAPSASSDVR